MASAKEAGPELMMTMVMLVTIVTKKADDVNVSDDDRDDFGGGVI